MLILQLRHGVVVLLPHRGDACRVDDPGLSWLDLDSVHWLRLGRLCGRAGPSSRRRCRRRVQAGIGLGGQRRRAFVGGFLGEDFVDKVKGRLAAVGGNRSLRAIQLFRVRYLWILHRRNVYLRQRRRWRRRGALLLQAERLRVVRVRLQRAIDLRVERFLALPAVHQVRCQRRVPHWPCGAPVFNELVGAKSRGSDQQDRDDETDERFRRSARGGRRISHCGGSRWRGRRLCRRLCGRRHRWLRRRRRRWACLGSSVVEKRARAVHDGDGCRRRRHRWYRRFRGRQDGAAEQLRAGVRKRFFDGREGLCQRRGGVDRDAIRAHRGNHAGCEQHRGHARAGDPDPVLAVEIHQAVLVALRAQFGMRA